MNTEQIVFFALFTAAGAFAWLWALGTIVSPAAQHKTDFGAFLFCFGAWLFSGALGFSGLARQLPMAVVILVPVALLTAPFFERTLMRVAGEPIGHSWLRRAVQWVPMTVALGLSATAHLRGWFDLTNPDGPGTLLVQVLAAATKVLVLLHVGAFLFRNRSLWAATWPKETRRIVWILGGGTLLAVALGLPGMLGAGRIWLKISACAAPALLALAYLLSRRYPTALNETTQAAQRLRYEQSRIGHLDVVDTLARLRDWMDRERPYLDEDLSLGQLAAALGLSTHELSQLLNQHLEKGFRHFVNEYRVREARRLLVAEPERTILSIAYAAGFASRSAFHRAFQHHAGETPAAYRTRRTG